MSLRKKTLILIALTLAALILVIYIATSLIFVKSFSTLEETSIRRDCRMLSDSIDNELDQLNTKAGDWAVWDDSYIFVENANDSFIKSNLTENSLALLKINYMFFVNTAGRIVHSVGYDIKNNKKVLPPSEIIQHLSAGKYLVKHKSSGGYNVGIIKLGDKISLVSSRPIVDSLGRSPARGVLVWGLFLDDMLLAKLSRLTRLSITMKDYNDPSLPADFNTAKLMITDNNPTFVKPLDSKTVAGYFFLKDIYGQRVSIMQITSDRDVYHQGLAGSRYLIIAIVLVSLVFGVLIMILMEKFVLSRLTFLSRGLDDISKSADPSQRLEIKEADELSELTVSINTMLESLERSGNSILQTEERLAVTLRSIGDGVITTGTDGRTVMMNHVAELLTGFSQEESAGRPLGDIFIIADEINRIPCGDPVPDIIESGKSISFLEQTILINRDGSEKIISVSGSPILDSENKAIGVVIVFRDMTESRKMQDELLRAQKLESIQSLAGGIAHDFNNILMGIIANISLIKMRLDPDPENSEIIKDTEAACFRAKGLTQQLLTFTKGGSPVKTTSSIGDILREASTFALSGSNVRCEISLSEDIWAVKIDIGQIHQVINNLIINSCQAMPDGGVINIKAENTSVKKNYHNAGKSYPHIKPGKYIRIKFSDRGSGIPKEIIARIFDPYFTTKPQGNGLGLSIVYSIIKKHDGFLDLESKPGKGTVFYIYLPSDGEIHKEIIIDEKTAVSGRGRILIMDDDDAIRKSVSKMVSYLGYEVESCGDGGTAIELYIKQINKGDPFNLIIMDLTIPGGLGGKETMRRLIEIDPAVKAVVSSGYSNDPIMSDYKKYGFSGVITKPYSVEDLADLLKSLLPIE